jgi:hypothetical protein
MIPRSTTITAEGRRLRRVVVRVVAILVVGNVLAALLGPLLQGERVAGPAGSSYVTTAYGTAALAELIGSDGIPITRLRDPITLDRLDSSQTLFMIEVGFTTLAETESAALSRFIDEGGRLVLAGPDPDQLMGSLGGPDGVPVWKLGGPPTATSTFPGVNEVPLAGEGQFDAWKGLGVFLRGDSDEVVGVEWDYGEGTVSWLADSTPFLNLGLADGDAAGLAMSLVAGRGVVFDELRHGFGGQSFWQLLPDGWATALALLGIAGLAWMIAYGRRLGSPEETERRLQPERAAYVEAVAAILGRTEQIGEAIAPVRARARRLLANRARLGPDASDEDFRRAATEAGIAPEDIEAIIGGSEDVVAAGRVLARLSTRR